MSDLSWACWAGVAALVAIVVVSAIVLLSEAARVVFPRSTWGDE